MISILMSINSKIKFTGRYFLVTSPSTVIPERLPIKNICEISSHIFLYRFIASTIITIIIANIKIIATIAKILITQASPPRISYFLIEPIIISRIYQPFTKSNIPCEWNPKKIYEIMLKSTILYDCKQDYCNVSYSPEIFCVPHFFGSGLYFFFRFTDFHLCTFLFITGFCFCLFHLFLCFFLFLLCIIYCFNR